MSNLSKRELLERYGSKTNNKISKKKKHKKYGDGLKIIDNEIAVEHADFEDSPVLNQVNFESKFTKNTWNIIQEAAPSSRERQRSPSLSPRVSHQQSRRSPSLSPRRSISPPGRRSPSITPPPQEQKMSNGARAGLNTRDSFLSIKEQTLPIISQKQTIYRDAAGRKINIDEQVAEHIRLKKEQQLKEENRRLVSRGIVQSQNLLTEQEELEIAKNRGLAVYSDDEEHNEYMKEKVHWGDAMASNTKKKGKSGRPIYEGPPSYNRFNILPGYRWDGIDRSNGFEVRLHQTRHLNAEAREEYQKWATEDM